MQLIEDQGLPTHYWHDFHFSGSSNQFQADLYSPTALVKFLYWYYRHRSVVTQIIENNGLVPFPSNNLKQRDHGAGNILLFMKPWTAAKKL